MVESIGNNCRLDEILREKLKNDRLKSITARIVPAYDFGEDTYFVLTEAEFQEGRRKFISAYKGDPLEFLGRLRRTLDEMFSCHVETYFMSTLYYG